MTEYIERDIAVTIADYAIDEHPYDKKPEKPETFSEYNQGWHDACDYIRNTLDEEAECADVAPVRHGRWVWKHRHYGGFHKYTGVDEHGVSHTITVDDRCETEEPYCPYCGKWNESVFRSYCPNCGAKMDGGDNNA